MRRIFEDEAGRLACEQFGEGDVLAHERLDHRRVIELTSATSWKHCSVIAWIVLHAGLVDLRRLTPPGFVAGITLIWRLSGGRWWRDPERSRLRAVGVQQHRRRGR